MATNPFQYSQGFPQDMTFVDEGRVLQPAWHYFLLALWNKTGQTTPVSSSFYISLATNTDGQLVPFLFSANGTAIGEIAISTPREAPQVLDLGSTTYPGSFVFQAPVTGFLTIPGGKVEYSRDGTLYFEIGLIGGQIWVLDGDFVRITWLNAAGPPNPVVWWAGGGVQ